jgi:hypothetical protein
LDKCDKGILQKIVKSLGSHDKLDKEVAATVLYGSFRGDRMLDHIAQLLLAPPINEKPLKGQPG